jgi:hypothetical protein
MNSSQVAVPTILLAIVGGAAVAWLIRRLRPAMPLTRRVLYITVGGVLIGGFLSGTLLNR